jgi:hypothetical protein
MVKATIKSKTGAIITIEGSEKEVANIVSNFERTTVIGEMKKNISKNQTEKTQEKKRKAASDLIVELKEEGFFDKPKTLTEIAKELEDGGYIYPTTTLSGVMIGLVQKKLFGRKKINSKWAYGK